MNLIFQNYKFRASQIGNLMTNLETITPKQEQELSELLSRQEQSKNGNAKPLTQNMQDKLAELLDKKNQKPTLPQGAISYLQEVFRDVYWGRKRTPYNKFLEKGNLCEQDALDLLSQYDNDFYYKNEELLENNFINGTPDNRQEIIRDTKVNYDLESFDKAELTTQYLYQIKSYCWLDKKTKGQLCYCLVNNPIHHIEQERKSLWYRMGMPVETDTEWIEAHKQLERNMIFDPIKFKEQYPEYEFVNPESDLYIPPQFRVKKFDIELTQQDIENITTRVVLAREWLTEKELETINKLNQFIKENNEISINGYIAMA